LEILYPYSTIFPVRDKLFTDDWVGMDCRTFPVGLGPASKIF
jgi:hypothetical protein